MTRIARLGDMLGLDGLGGRGQSRVVAISLLLDTNLKPDFVVSEPIGNRVVIRHIWIDTIFLSAGVGPTIAFWMTTGTGRRVSYAQVREWQELVPVRWSDGQGAFGIVCDMCSYDWSMNLPLVGDGRRFGLAAILTGTANANMFMSVEFEEG